MKKTISITLGKQFFHIEESAYIKLDNYLTAVKNSLDNEGKEEIINDIEDRIAELFFERYNQNLHTITDEDVDYIISVLGQPEDYALGETSTNKTKNTQNENKNVFDQVKRKRLYRDGHSRLLGGVCSGFAHYLGTDPVWIRLIVLILVFFFGLSIFIYPLLWLIIPKATTPSQILEMKGVPINLGNISEEVKNSMGKYIEIGKEKSNEFLFFLKKIGGVFAILLSVFFLFVIIAGLFTLYLDTYPFSNEKFFTATTLPFSPSFAYAVFGLTAALPFVWILLVGIKLVNGNAKISGKWTLFSIILWIGLLVFSGYLAKGFLVEFKHDRINNYSETNFIEQTNFKDEFMIDTDSENIFTVELFEDYRSENLDAEESENIKINFYSTTEKPYVLLNEKRVSMKTSNTNSNLFSKNSTSVNKQIPLKYNYNFSENKLSLAKEIVYPIGIDENNFTGNVTVDIYLNEGQKVKINSDDSEYFSIPLQPYHSIYVMKNNVLIPLN